MASLRFCVRAAAMGEPPVQGASVHRGRDRAARGDLKLAGSPMERTRKTKTPASYGLASAGQNRSGKRKRPRAVSWRAPDANRTVALLIATAVPDVQSNDGSPIFRLFQTRRRSVSDHADSSWRKATSSARKVAAEAARATATRKARAWVGLNRSA